MIQSRLPFFCICKAHSSLCYIFFSTFIYLVFEKERLYKEFSLWFPRWNVFMTSKGIFAVSVSDIRRSFKSFRNAICNNLMQIHLFKTVGNNVLHGFSLRSHSARYLNIIDINTEHSMSRNWNQVCNMRSSCLTLNLQQICFGYRVTTL